MTKVWKVFNPTTGLYDTYDTSDSAEAAARDIAWNSYLRQTHNKPISEVDVMDSGEEIWI